VQKINANKNYKEVESNTLFYTVKTTLVISVNDNVLLLIFYYGLTIFYVAKRVYTVVFIL